MLRHWFYKDLIIINPVSRLGRKFERSNLTVEGGNPDEPIRSHRSALEQHNTAVIDEQNKMVCK
jgi:hypothetical protein